MEAIGLFTFLVSSIIGLIMFLAIMKIFSISHDIGVIKKNIVDFTKILLSASGF
ncbi:MAG: hypothetical protein UZ05_CHB002002221 [Chlorobi bacterium OLB5]|nr:MAG: hypothetical protein UZ05_CHB002002221 [Chlorobi bacterium OLB5]